MKPAVLFDFTSYSYIAEEHTATFSYTVTFEDSEKKIFTEKIHFPSQLKPRELPSTLLNHALESIHLILGISYWKMYCPPKIQVSSTSLSEKQAEFWKIVYRKGLGEFFYRNNIDFRDRINFPYQEDTEGDYFEIPTQKRALVGIGGGKDSIVSVELLKHHGIPITGYVVENKGQHTSVDALVKKMNIGSIKVVRELDQQVSQLKDVYKGHVPVSAIYAFVGILTALFYNYAYVIVSNEDSANEGNAYLNGEMVNHQWSKSIEFEELAQEYISSFITPSVTYFSLLRPFSELKVVELFIKYPYYFNHFSSCNRNFTITNAHKHSLHWCGECPKCAFAFAMLSAFLPRVDVHRIFQKNVYADEQLIPLYKELLGIGEIKPFDCVGTPDEVITAMYKAYVSGEYADTEVMKMFEQEIVNKGYNFDGIEKKAFATHRKDRIPHQLLPVIQSL